MNDSTGILITPKMIQDMIGIPMGSIAVTEVPAATIEFLLIVEWRQTLRVKEAYRYVKKERLTKGKIREMKNSPAKDQGDILRHVYTPKVNLEDGVFGDVEGSSKMEAIKQFQKRTTEDMQIDINKTLKFAGSIQTKVNEMIEMASIAYPKNEIFKNLVEIRNEKLLKAFKPGKICAVLESDNEVQSNEHNNNEQAPDEKELQNTDGFLVSQPYLNSQPVEMQSTTIEITKDDLVANIEEDVVGSGNTLTLDEINITPEENMGLNSGNNKDGENRELNVGSSKDGEERTISQLLVNLQRRTEDKDENGQISGSTQNSGKKRLCDFTTPNFNMLSPSDPLNDLPKVCTLPFVNPTQTEITRIKMNEEGDQRKSANAQVVKDKPARKEINTRNKKGDSAKYQQNVDNNDQTMIQNEDSISNDVNVGLVTKKHQHVYAKRTKLSLKKGCEGMIESSQGAGYATVVDQEKQICPVATVQEGHVSVIGAINAVPIRYMEPTKDGIDEKKEKRVRELSEALCSPYVKRKVSVTNKLQAVEKPVVENIFTARYPAG
ncbi:hypothetical protein Tco_1449529 [Tanacetum coccineum]